MLYGHSQIYDSSVHSKDDKRLLPNEKIKKVVGKIKDKLGGKIMTEFVALRTKMYAYRKIDKNSEDYCWKSTNT